MTTEAPSTLTPKVLTDDERFIETKLQQFTISKESLREMAGKYTDLIAQGKDADLKVIYVARQTLKKKRTEITNFGKSLRTSAVAFQKAVIAREDELIAEIEPTEKALETIEDGIIEEKRKAKEEADRKKWEEDKTKEIEQNVYARMSIPEIGPGNTAEGSPFHTLGDNAKSDQQPSRAENRQEFAKKFRNVDFTIGS